MMIDQRLDHEKAKSLHRQEAEVSFIRRRAENWRLTDCSVAALEQMRHALIVEMERLQEKLETLDNQFLQTINGGMPLQAEESREDIERLSNQWDSLNKRLQEIDHALQERTLRDRLIKTLGGEQNLLLLDISVFVSIILVIGLTLMEWFLPLSPETFSLFITIDTVVCFFLIGDFLLRWRLAEDSSWYFRRYWIDLVASIPFYEFLRFGRLLRLARFARLFRLLRLSRALRVLLFSFRGLNKLTQTFQINLLKRAIVIAAILLIVGAFSISLFEASLNAPENLGEGLWWSFTTVVTGGFADLYNPSTVSGRLLTVGLVLLGLTVTGIFTASLTSVLVEDESMRLERNQHALEVQIEDVNRKVDLLSHETNQGLIALETVAQVLSSQTSRSGVARVLVNTLLDDFNAVQASVHLLDGDRNHLQLIARGGAAKLSPADNLFVGDGFPGRVVADLLAEEALGEVDLEPETELVITLPGKAMACPIVAGTKVLGVMHLVLPDEIARYYLYNRVPMTLAHHAAMAIRVADLTNSGSGS
jgi:voltage-gated potassium channel